MPVLLSRFCFIFTASLCFALTSHADNAPSGSITTATVKQIQSPQLRILDATIEAVHKATVSAQTRGRIIEITVDVDDYVSKGAVIIRMRDKGQRAAFNAAEARFEEAQADHKRIKEVYAKKLVAKAMLDKAEASLKARRANMAQAEEALEHTLVRAPYSGIVVKRHVEVGEVARVGQKLMTGLSLEKLRATVNLPQSLIHDVRKYKKAWVWVGKQKDKKVASASLTISSFADPVTRTFAVRVNLAASDLQIYPGMHTKVAFLTGEITRMVIPVSAVVHRSEVTGVYVQDESKNIRFRYVRVGELLDDKQIEILAGLVVGESVILDPVRATNLRSTDKDSAATPAQKD